MRDASQVGRELIDTGCLGEIMAWRPYDYLIRGFLSNAQLGRVTGELVFSGMDEIVRLDLVGDFHRDIRGAGLELLGDPRARSLANEARAFMKNFSTTQTGKVGDITTGLPPHDYGRQPYIEWYSDQNGRVVLEYAHDQVRVHGKPVPCQESYPVLREEQQRNMVEFLREMGEAFMRQEEEKIDDEGEN